MLLRFIMQRSTSTRSDLLIQIGVVNEFGTWTSSRRAFATFCLNE